MNETQLRSDELVITSGIFSVWSRYWDPDLDQAPDVNAEYILTVGVADALHNLYSGCVALEASVLGLGPTTTRALFLEKSAPLQRQSRKSHKIGSPLPTGIREGRIDVVVYRDKDRLVPRLLVELKRHANRGEIKSDAERLVDVLTSFDGEYHSDLDAYCAFPVFLGDGTNDDEERLAGMVQAKLEWLHDYAVELSTHVQNKIAVSVVPNVKARCQKYPYRTEVFDNGTSEDVADRPGFTMISVALRLQRLSST